VGGEILSKAIGKLSKKPAENALPERTFWPSKEANSLRDQPFNGFIDFKKGDALWGTGKRETPSRPTGGHHKLCFAQALENLRQMVKGRHLSFQPSLSP